MVEDLRLGVEVKVIVSNGRAFPEILRETSKQADLIFLGLPEPEEDFATDYGRLMSWTEVATTIFVLAASDYDYEEVLAEDS